MAERFQTYGEFWPFYLREHRQTLTRALHYLGTTLGVLLLIVAIASGDWRFVPAAVVAGYGFAWIGHLRVERNRPATFTHPFWSFVSDFRMLGLWLTGRLAAELAKAGVGESVRPRSQG